MRGFIALARRAAGHAAHATLEGRLIERGRPERGRFLRSDVDAILRHAREEHDALLRQAQLEALPTWGSRHNAALALLTIAAYRALVHAGVSRSYATELVADIGWRLFAKMLRVPRRIGRLLARDPQRQLDWALRVLLLYPFRAAGRPGYACTAWAERDRFCTFWTHCPPYQAVREVVERDGDHGELRAFRAAWCGYDWAAIRELTEGSPAGGGYYERPHSLSAGDDVCDMTWFAIPPPRVRRRLPPRERLSPAERLAQHAHG